MSLFAELGLSVAFTLISLAPMVPDWLKANEGPTINVKLMAGIPYLNSEQMQDEEKKEEEYAKQSFGGAVPIITLFNQNGDRLAYRLNDSGKQKLGHGSTEDYQATYFDDVGTQKPEYILVQASGPDAICLAAVTVTHPKSSDTYAFLPGETGKVCGDWNQEMFNISWSNSGETVQFKAPDGKVEAARPKCLWIDSPDSGRTAATKIKGFQVHLPDFKLDNSRFKEWEGDTYQMCGSRARFGVFNALHEYMCPLVFEKPPEWGATLPMNELLPCVPGVWWDKDGYFQEIWCDDKRLTPGEKGKLMRSFGRNPKNYCQKKRAIRHDRRIASPQMLSHDRQNAIQKRFVGQLVKSHDRSQSAVETCESMQSIGPNFYSYHEEKFCDMATRKLYPRCATSDDTQCFDEQLNETRHVYERRAEKVVHLAVEDWV